MCTNKYYKFVLKFKTCRKNFNTNLQYLFVHMLVYDKLLKPNGHLMHHQFNIQQLYALSTLYLCVLYLSENKQRLVPLTA